jgi:predicted transposase/invertase (TIGR01784 family)
MRHKHFPKRTYVSFDWAIKRLLRKKADFTVLEGFLSVLLKKEVKVESLLESESNREAVDDKMVVVDVLCKLNNGDLVIVEVQFFHQADYFHRMMYGVSKVLAEHLKAGEKYEKVKKVISVSLVYFDLGHGKDYLYRGHTVFSGMNLEDELELSALQKQTYSKATPQELFPEYYLIKINNFNNVSRSPLEDWVYYFKNSELPSKCDKKILSLLSEQLKFDAMDTKEKQDYYRFSKSKRIWDSTIDTAFMEGVEEGIQKGIQKGLEQGIEQGMEKTKVQTIVLAFKKGLAISLISEIVRIPEEEVERILKEEDLI